MISIDPWLLRSNYWLGTLQSTLVRTPATARLGTEEKSGDFLEETYDMNSFIMFYMVCVAFYDGIVLLGIPWKSYGDLGN